MFKQKYWKKVHNIQLGGLGVQTYYKKHMYTDTADSFNHFRTKQSWAEFMELVGITQTQSMPTLNDCDRKIAEEWRKPNKDIYIVIVYVTWKSEVLRTNIFLFIWVYVGSFTILYCDQ